MIPASELESARTPRAVPLARGHSGQAAPSWALPESLFSRCTLVTAVLFTAVLVGCGSGEAVEPGAGPRADPGAGSSSSAVLARTRVLVTLVDACAADFVTPYGAGPEATPFLARFAERGHLFEDVTAAAPYTLASVASLFTGEHVDVHGVTRAEEVLPAHLTTLAEAFQRAGLHTLGVSTNAHVRGQAGFAHGFDEFHRIRPRLGEGRPHEVPEEVLAHFTKLLDDSQDEPWFAYLHLMPPHAPYTAPLTARASVGAEGIDLSLGSLEHLAPLTVGARLATRNETEEITRLYAASLRYVDGVLATIDALLTERGLDEDVLWIVLSDHGEAFGEHGLFQHSSTVHEEMVRVPLLVRFPASARATFLPEGARHADPVSTVDLFATLRELCGLDVDRPFSSTSLVPLLRGEALVREVPIVSRTAGPDIHRALRRGELKLLSLPGRERPLLFDLAVDPGEHEDVARDRRPAARALLEDLEAWRKLARRRRGEGETGRAELDEATLEELRAIGYADQ